MHVYCLEVQENVKIHSFPFSFFKIITFSRHMVGYLVYMVGSVYGLAMAGGAVEVNKLLPT